MMRATVTDRATGRLCTRSWLNVRSSSTAAPFNYWFTTHVRWFAAMQEP